MSMSLRAMLDERPMTRFQQSAVAICILLNVFDGFDVLVMAFTGRAVSAEWGLNPGQLGLLLSAGMIGIGMGALFVAPFADRIGRRPTVLICLLIAASGMMLASASANAIQLGALRVVTGIGIGGLLASSNVLASEYSSRRWRSLAVSLNSLGYALGATLGGLLAVLLTAELGWRAVFLLGGAGTLAVIPVVALGMPESLDFLLARRPRNALSRVNALADRLAMPRVIELPRVQDPLSRSTGVVNGFQTLFGSDLRRSTLVLSVAFLLIIGSFHFVTSWTPILLVEAGLSTHQGLTGGTLLNLGGMAGTILFGLLTSRWALRPVLLAYVLITASLMGLFVLAQSTFAMSLIAGTLLGMFVTGCVAGVMALLPTVYDARVRATGVGAVLGIGRAGAILSPAAAGFMLQLGWTPRSLYLAFGAILFVSAGILVLLRASTALSPPAQSPPPMPASTQI